MIGKQRSSQGHGTTITNHTNNSHNWVIRKIQEETVPKMVFRQIKDHLEHKRLRFRRVKSFGPLSKI